MKTKVLVGALVFLIVVNLATLGTWLYVRFVAPPEPPLFAAGGPPPMRDLDEATRERLRSVMMTFRESVRPLQREVRMAEDSVAVLLQLDPVPVEQIRPLLRRVADLRIAISERAITHLVDTKSFLTPEQQRALFRAVIEAQPRGPRSGDGPGRGPGRGPGSRPGPPFGRPDSQEFESRP